LIEVGYFHFFFRAMGARVLSRLFPV
jgi:hypothetical protein